MPFLSAYTDQCLIVNLSLLNTFYVVLVQISLVADNEDSWESALITGGTGGFGKAFAKALLNGNAAAVSLHIILKSDLIFMMFSAVIILEFSTSISEFDCSLVTRDKANDCENGLLTQCTPYCESIVSRCGNVGY